MARYFVNSQMLFLASPEFFSEIDKTNTLVVPSSLNPQALKMLLDYFHGHAIPTNLNPPDMSIIPELYVAAAYFKLHHITEKIKHELYQSNTALKFYALQEMAADLPKLVYLQDKNKSPSSNKPK